MMINYHYIYIHRIPFTLSPPHTHTQTQNSVRRHSRMRFIQLDLSNRIGCWLFIESSKENK